MRLIDADALNKAFDKSEAIEEIYGSDGLPVISEVIDAAPTIEAEPVRHGKWIIEDNPGTGWYLVECSECCENVTSTAPCIGFPPNAKVTWDYCPYCGAKMDGGTP